MFQYQGDDNKVATALVEVLKSAKKLLDLKVADQQFENNRKGIR